MRAYEYHLSEVPGSVSPKVQSLSLDVVSNLVFIAWMQSMKALYLLHVHSISIQLKYYCCDVQSDITNNTVALKTLFNNL